MPFFGIRFLIGHDIFILESISFCTECFEAWDNGERHPLLCFITVLYQVESHVTSRWWPIESEWSRDIQCLTVLYNHRSCLLPKYSQIPRRKLYPCLAAVLCTPSLPSLWQTSLVTFISLAVLNIPHQSKCLTTFYWNNKWTKNSKESRLDFSCFIHPDGFGLTTSQARGWVGVRGQGTGSEQCNYILSVKKTIIELSTVETQCASRVTLKFSSSQAYSFNVAVKVSANKWLKST